MRRILPAALLAAALLHPGTAAAKIRVAASTTDIGSIAATVGGDQVEVFAIARANADPHRIEALPSYMVKVSRAQVFLEVGLGLDQWADAIVEGSRNDKILKVDCSQGVRVLEKPTHVDASMGDVHPDGNPHYWLDPRNGAVVARNAADAFARVDPAHAADYHARAEAFGKECQAAYEHSRAIADKLPSRAIFTYHRSWSYFVDAFGFDVVATAEPVPGIPPTAKHLIELEQLAKSRKVTLLLQEPYFSMDAGQFLSRGSGVRVVAASSACDSEAPGSYLAHFDSLMRAIAGGPAR
jgi:ABC-type Zn uptake system ZnuABC Zn-binding protein ZnuA